ncbi:hypothetical protein ACWCXC_15540 [Streptomyces sp. NPDC001515]
MQTLPFHPLTGDQALGFRKSGTPIWPIKGGSGEGDPGSDPGTEPDGKPGTDPNDNPGTDPEAVLGDAGKKAIKAERDARKTAEKERDDAHAEVKRLQRANAAVKGHDLEAIKAEIREEFKEQINSAALRAEAKGRLADPSDVGRYLDVKTLDGEEAIKAAVDQLLKDRPYLAAASTSDKPWGEVGGGKQPSGDPEPSSPQERMARAYGSKAKS